MDKFEPKSAPTKRILLVDDDERVLFVLSASLRRMPACYDVVTVQDGRAACDLLETATFDLLVTDIRLPEIDGITLTDLVRTRLPQLPVIWVTAYGCRGLQGEAERLCVFRCLEKPVEMHAFRQIVQQALTLRAPPLMEQST